MGGLRTGAGRKKKPHETLLTVNAEGETILKELKFEIFKLWENLLSNTPPTRTAMGGL